MMSNLVKFQDKRTKLASQNQLNLLEKSQERFKQLDIFEGQLFEADYWQYGTTKLYFSSLPADKPKSRKERIAWPQGIVDSAKTYIVAHLWDTRLRQPPLSATRISDLIQPLRFLVELGVESVDEINYDKYWAAYSNILEHYKRPVEPLQDLNSFIKFLADEYLLKSQIDIISPHKNKLVQQKLPTVALPEKMPVPELVRAVIQLKWKVEEEFERNPNDRTASDLMCVYTQAFQYGLGLRIGEVLRLPVDCLFEYEGKMLCKVWTEKGMMPHARFVPDLWSSIFQEIVDKIKEITAPYRSNAAALEANEVYPDIDERLNNFKAVRNTNAQVLFNELEHSFEKFEKAAIKAWQLKRPVHHSTEYSLEELDDILPIFISEKAVSMKAKKYSSWGMNIQSEPLTKNRNRFYVTGDDITEFVEFHINQRRNFITQLELNSVIQGREMKRDVSRDRLFIDSSIEMDGSTAACYTFAPDEFKGKGRAPTAIEKSKAIEICTAYAHGSYDIENWIDVITFRRYFPEIPLIPSVNGKDFVARNPELEISAKHKLTVLTNTDTENGIRYSVNEGYSISHASIKRYIKNRFESLNYEIKKELSEVDEQDKVDTTNELVPVADIPKTITIQSRSFKVEQKVSEYLFLRADIGTGGTLPNPLIPEILSYNAVAYFFVGNDRYTNAFERFDVDCGKHVAESWQSHKGRHWRTTSLFRAGVQEAIINKWMGRTELQGRHYDHNTGSERAEAVGKLMMEDQNRFLGEIPHKIRKFIKDEIPTTEIKEYLDSSMQTVQYTPLGYCVRSLNLKPCDLNMKCLVGADGNGCKHFIFDLKDDVQRERLIAFRDKTGEELLRLIDALEEKGIQAAQMHIDQQKPLYINATNTLKQADNLLGTNFAESKTEFMPFLKNGTYPDDCPFQCGDK